MELVSSVVASLWLRVSLLAVAMAKGQSGRWGRTQAIREGFLERVIFARWL